MSSNYVTKLTTCLCSVFQDEQAHADYLDHDTHRLLAELEKARKRYSILKTWHYSINWLCSLETIRGWPVNQGWDQPIRLYLDLRIQIMLGTCEWVDNGFPVSPQILSAISGKSRLDLEWKEKVTIRLFPYHSLLISWECFIVISFYL